MHVHENKTPALGGRIIHKHLGLSGDQDGEVTSL